MVDTRSTSQKKIFKIQVSDIPDVELTTVETKKRTKLQAHMHNNNSIQRFAPRFSKTLQLQYVLWELHRS